MIFLSLYRLLIKHILSSQYLACGNLHETKLLSLATNLDQQIHCNEGLLETTFSSLEQQIKVLIFF